MNIDVAISYFADSQFRDEFFSIYLTIFFAEGIFFLPKAKTQIDD